MKKDKLIPKRRFKEFKNNEAWEQRKFSDLVTRVSKSSSEDKLPRVEYEDIISGQGILNKDIFDKESYKRGIEFEIGDTLFGKLRPYLQNWLLADFNGIAVGDWWVLRPNGISSKFIYNIIQGSKYQVVANLSTGTKMPRSDWNVVSQTEFAVPRGLEEQEKIGSFFTNLDNLITLHQRKLKKLKELKLAYLSEMFPKEGEKYPIRRFAGFTDPWEQRKLSDFADKAVDNRGKTPPLDSKGTHPLIEVASLGTGSPDYSKVEKYLNDYSFEHHLRDYIKKGDILFSTVGSIGLVSLMDDRENSAIAQNIVAFRAKENYSPEYLYALFSTESSKTKAHRIAMGAVQPSIKVSQLVDVKYFVTNDKKEQEQIGEFFIKLDNLITLHQRKLEKLENIKKAYLNEMFV